MSYSSLFKAKKGKGKGHRTESPTNLDVTEENKVDEETSVANEGKIHLLHGYSFCPAFSQFDWLIIGEIIGHFWMNSATE